MAKKAKKQKMKGCGATFTLLGGRVGDFKEGVWVFWKLKSIICGFEYKLPWYFGYSGV